MATSYGIDAFCYYTYLFDKDKALLDKPLNILLNNLDINQKFCICWANENWTRTWDGKDKELLIEQKYSEELLNFFPEYIERYISDKRYVRDRNRPLILIYRPEKIPNISYWSNQWREYFRKKLNIEILLCKVNSFINQSAADINFDLNIEFPPNISSPNKVENNIYPKTLNIFDYNTFLNEEYHFQQNQKSLIRSAFPSWDNTPRRQENGTIFLNSNPGKFYQYIQLCKKFRPKIEKLDNNYLFINSWNEWAEGAQIEPDNTNHFNYLTANHLAKNEVSNPNILLITHDLHGHGAQFLALNLVKYLKNYFNIHVISLGPGILEQDFIKNSKSFFKFSGDEESLNIYIKKILENFKFKLVIINTIVSGKILNILKKNNQYKIIHLIHELPKYIIDHKYIDNLFLSKKISDFIIFPSLEAKNKIIYKFRINDNKKIKIIPQGIFERNKLSVLNKYEKNLIKKKLNISENKKIILNIAYGDRRKGFDLFYNEAKRFIEDENYIFVWVGEISEEFKEYSLYEINFLHFNFTKNIKEFLAIADIFFFNKS